MNKSSKKALAGEHTNVHSQEYGEMIDMIESGMEDYEIAAELGITSNHVSDITKEIYNDMI
jgi:DNA-binding NarL/FixJ family response regulator